MGILYIYTSISSKTAAVKLLGEDHGRPAEIRVIVVNSLAEGELRGGMSAMGGGPRAMLHFLTDLAIANHGCAGIYELVLLPREVK